MGRVFNLFGRTPESIGALGGSGKRRESIAMVAS